MNTKKQPWWSGKPKERFWCEITDRKDIGADLICPQADESGRPFWSYSIIQMIRPEEVVFHYSTREKSFVGASKVLAIAREDQLAWTPHGLIARSKRQPRSSRAAWSVPIGYFKKAKQPLTLPKIQLDQGWVRNWIEEKQSEFGTVAAPFQLYPKKLRASQGYLTKMPADFVRHWRELHDLAELLIDIDISPKTLTASAEIGNIDETAIDIAAQLKSSRSGQTFMKMSAKLRRAIEEYAVEKAKSHYLKKSYAVKVMGKPYDLHCVDKLGKELHVEVKGTQSRGEEILLTPNEVRFAQLHKSSMALFVVQGIKVSDRNNDETFQISGGISEIYEPWDVDNSILEPIGYFAKLKNKAEVSA